MMTSDLKILSLKPEIKEMKMAMWSETSFESLHCNPCFTDV